MNFKYCQSYPFSMCKSRATSTSFPGHVFDFFIKVMGTGLVRIYSYFIDKAKSMIVKICLFKRAVSIKNINAVKVKQTAAFNLNLRCI